jgi:single-strand DNA-binding protein
MASLNKVQLIGNLGRDPEMRYTANGTAQTQFSVAVSRNFRGPDGEWKEETEWFNVVAWRDLAERMSQQVTKGKQIYVEGRLQTRSWDNDQGVKQYRTEVIAERIMVLERRERDAGAGGADGGGAGFSAPAREPAQGGNVGNFGGGARSGGGARQPIDDPDDLPFE